ncbi:transcriptional regulator (plasmid) [Halococcus dombrowskii]|uniref:Transcriptional regulator n=1 Tax=Halococcus dombrowskii TaxID=179637 RepID=A0AAV3SET4_HALDO|nr:type IV toxin-antitoxin system AbiEi family antitoxin [Halococcus dombrowskii]UOO96712.1 transcriptional regulator [Halococcus dombrowskii]
MGTSTEISIKQGLSKREALALTRLAGQNKTVVTITDIEHSVNISYDAAKKLAHNLVQKKWLDRVKSGTYLIVPLAAGERGEYTEHEFIIAAHLAKPMYISYGSALNHYSLTEQVPMTVVAATTDRVPDREIHNVQYRFVTLTDTKFFGYEPVAIGSQQVNIATVEKALVDCADHPEHCGGITELSKALVNADSVDYDTLVGDLLRMGNGAAVKRIVYLADLHDIELPRRADLEEAFTTGYSKLDPTRADNGRHTSDYRLILNVAEDALQTGRSMDD